MDVVAKIRAEARVSPGPELDRVRAAAAGDRDAVAALYQHYVPMVHALLLARVPPAEAGDLVQDVFLTALGRLHELRDADAFGAWLGTIARRRAADFHRARTRASEEPLEQSGQHGQHGPPQAEVAQVLAIIRELPTAYQETLLMRLVGGLTGPEIAERTGMTPGSVRINLHRGMRLLRERLGQEVDP